MYEQKLRLEKGVTEFKYFYATQVTCISVVIELLLFNKLFQFALLNPPSEILELKTKEIGLDPEQEDNLTDSLDADKYL